MRGYIQLFSTLAFVLVIFWLATRNTRRARKAQRVGGNGDGGWLEPRVAELEALAVAEDQWRIQVEQRLAALEQAQAPLYRVQ